MRIPSLTSGPDHPPTPPRFDTGEHSSDPFDGAYYRILAHGHARNGRWAQASQAFRRALAFQPDDPDTLASLGDAELAQARWPQAHAAYRRALTLSAGCAPALSGLGRLACDRLQFSLADGYFQRSLRADPAQGRAWAARIQICRLRQAVSQARMLLRAAQCIVCDPAQTFWLALAEASLLQDAGDVSGADRLLQQAIEALPPEPPVEAHRLYNTLAALRHPSDHSLSPRQARSQMRLYSQSLALFPPQPIQWRRLAMTYTCLSDFPQALACLGKALEEDPTFVACQYDRSRILYWLGDLQAANEALAEVIAQAPVWREPYGDLARNLKEQGDTLGARRIRRLLQCMESA